MTSPVDAARPPDLAWDDDMVMLQRDDVSDFNEENILPQPPETIIKIRKWLQPTNYDDEGSEHRKHLASHLSGTGSWLLSSAVYKEWHTSDEYGMLWIRGIPGSGKSVFAATLINHLAQERVPVLYFYFRQIIDANYSPIAALRDWLAQVLNFSPSLQMKLKEYLDGGRYLESLSTPDLWSHLRTALSYLPKVYCIVDALDEMDQGSDMEQFLQSLAQLGEWQPSKVKIIITSRPVASIERHLRMAKSLHIRLEKQMVDVDIATYVQYRLAKSSIPAKDHASIINAVPGRASSLFLYAKLAMDAFLRPNADVQDVLDQLPTDLNFMYTGLLREHTRRSGIPEEVQLLIMQWVTHATRPLRLLEIAEMINVTQYPQDKRDLKAAKDLVRSACGPLLEILPDETVSVVHHSLTEFLNGSTREAKSHDYPVLEFGSTHNRLALICLSYLKSACVDEHVIIQILLHLRATYRPPGHLLPAFTEYAASNWPIHARKAAVAGADQTEVNNCIDKFLTAANFRELPFGALGRCNPTPLFAAVKLGLTDYARTLLSRPGTDVNKVNRDELVGKNSHLHIEGESPLCYAARKNYDEIVDLLLQHNADPKEFDQRGLTALHHAASNNNPKVITLLLEADVDPFISSHRRFIDARVEPALMLACSHGHVEAVTSFLPHLKSSDSVSLALGWAVEYRRVKLVQLILGHSLVKINTKTQSQTPLCIACSYRDPETIRVLLDANANPNVLHSTPGSSEPTSERGYTALHAWAKQQRPWLQGHGRLGELDPEATTECFELMMKAGANIHQEDINGNATVHHAIDAVAMRLLMDGGANPNAINDNGETVLHLCQDQAVVQLLLEEGKVDTSLKTHRDGHTPLISLLSSENIFPVQATENALRLLEFGADASGIDNNGNGAFHHAIGIMNTTNCERLIESLRGAGANINLKNHQGKTPLQVMDVGVKGPRFPGIPWILGKFNDKLFNALLAAGADPELRDYEGQTVLFQRIKSGPPGGTELIDLCEKMTKAGARIDTVDFKGQTLFDASLSSRFPGDMSFFRFLIARGLDPKQKDYDGNTLWHKAVLYHTKMRVGVNPKAPGIFQELIRLGVDHETPNNSGRTPLHLLSSFTPIEVREGKSPSIEHTTEFDYMLGFQKNVDFVDNDGVTALHLASTFSEYQTRRLLEAGADPLKATYEKLTPFHLAARSQQSNIIGMLLDSLRLRADQDAISAAVNAEDGFGNTILHYACASGRIESVRLLIDAGAKICTGSKSPWQSCVKFEEEQANWLPLNHNSNDPTIPDARAVLLYSDNRRPKDGEKSGFSTTRLDEILDFLVSRGPCEEQDIDQAISSAGKSGLDYTVDCLLRVRDTLKLEEAYEFEFEAKACLLRRQANRKAFEDCFSKDQTQTTPSLGLKSQFHHLMSLREYSLVVEMLLKESCLKADTNGDLIIHHLVLGGFASIIAKVLTNEEAGKLEDWDWCDKQEKASQAMNPSNRFQLLKPLLLAACERELPNMDVIRVLIENTRVDLNAQNRKYQGGVGYGGRYVKNECALHLLVRGNHWWQVNQALPYLVKHGADLEVRDADGITPLAAALDTIKLLTFTKRTVELLIKLGADVNAVDDKGISCLARAGDDNELIKLLLRHGAVVTHSAIITAINNKNAFILEALLSHGADPNTRQSINKEKPAPISQTNVAGTGRPRPQFDPDEMYPLHYAATRDRGNDKIHEEMVRILLDHGADPNAGYVETTIMHQIIEMNRFVGLFLELPHLDLESRDSSGSTLLHAACHSQEAQKDESTSTDTRSPIQILLDRGADIRTRDKSGQNALHHCFQTGLGTFTQTLELIASKAPELINEVDSNGSTPFHAVICRLYHSSTDTEVLISAGADLQLPSSNGDTPLHLLVRSPWWLNPDGAVIGPRRKVFDIFMKRGVNINSRNHSGETPIFGLFRCCNAPVQVHHESPQPYKYKTHQETEMERMNVREELLFEFLEQASVDWRAVNNDGETLLHVLAARQNYSFGPLAIKRFKFLMGKGLDPMQEDGNQRTSLDVAAAFGNKMILDLFESK